MYKVGDIVVYSATGVCEITEITKREFCKITANYYVLTPLTQKSATVFVPAENPALTKKMHPVFSKEEFLEAFEKAKTTEIVRPQNENERKQRFSEILDSGDRTSLLLAVYDLHRLQKEQIESSRRLHIADEKLLNSAENLLFDEVSYVFGIAPDNVLEFIQSHF